MSVVPRFVAYNAVLYGFAGNCGVFEVMAVALAGMLLSLD